MYAKSKTIFLFAIVLFSLPLLKASAQTDVEKDLNLDRGLQINEGMGDRDRDIRLDKIKYPISELGNCTSRDDCRNYCELAEHTDACLRFGKNNGLVNQDEARQTNRFIQSVKKGDAPVSGCTDEHDCLVKCSLPENVQACMQWAEDHGFKTPGTPAIHVPAISPSLPNTGPHIDKDKAKKILESRGGPGGCKTFDECTAYCDVAEHQTTCLDFAKSNGLMSEKEVAVAEKLITTPGPGGCKGIACQTYCEDSAHQKECLQFAKENDLISPEDQEKIEKFQNLIGPHGCRAEECKAVCDDPANGDECFKFAKDNGLLSQENIDMIEKMMNKPEESSPGLLSASCAETGGTWDGSSCVCPSTGTTFWNGRRCVIAYGTITDSATCNANEGFWMDAAKRCFSPEEWCTSGSGEWVIAPAPHCTHKDQEEACVKNGGTWSGEVCGGESPNGEFVAPTELPGYPLDSGQSSSTPNSSGSFFASPQTMCAKAGGIWDGSQCAISSPPPISYHPSLLKSLLSSVLYALWF